MELFALLTFWHIWFAIPLVIAYSLVYAATRHEEIKPICGHAARFAGWLFLFLIVVYFVLYFVT
ncbi:MAG: hypothetical protein PHQ75_12505 [Thermoguttaceae bacterium]|nr:hypothetical protein [Thermoguttaceae bacterium]